MSAHKGTCQHCRKPTWLKCRGLCTTCWNQPKVRDLYPPKIKRKVDGREPTEAQLEAMIRENYATMPLFEKEPGETAEPHTSPHCVRLCPRGARVIKGRRFAR